MVRGGAVEGGVLLPRQQGARGHAARGDQSNANYNIVLVMYSGTSLLH